MSPESAKPILEDIDDINDRKLIQWLRSNYMQIPFTNISPEKFNNIWLRKDRSKNLGDSIKALVEKRELHEQKDILENIWKDLVANAIIFLKLNDKREAFHDDGDYGIDELGDFFEEYCEFEKLLYGSSDFYRDHVSHVFKVFLLGEYLVKKKLGGFSNIDVMDGKLILKPSEIVNEYEEAEEETKEEKTRKYSISDEEKEAMWCIISLTHDLGYPTELMYQIPDRMRKMLSTFNIDISYTASQQSQIFNDFIVKLISSDLQQHEIISDGKRKVYYTTHLQTKYYSKYSRSLEMWDHGIETCILLVKTLVYFLETDLSLDKRKMMDILDARHFLIRQRILRAISSHSCDYIYNLKLDMSFLLRIVDDMQEWGRPKLSDLFSQPPSSQLKIYEFSTKKIDYAIQFEYEHDTPTSIDVTKVHTNVKEFFIRKVNTYITILRSAVDGKSRNFTLNFRVIDKIDDNGIKITYKFVHENSKSIHLYCCCEEDSFYREISMGLLKESKWDKFETQIKESSIVS